MLSCWVKAESLLWTFILLLWCQWTELTCIKLLSTNDWKYLTVATFESLWPRREIIHSTCGKDSSASLTLGSGWSALLLESSIGSCLLPFWESCGFNLKNSHSCGQSGRLCKPRDPEPSLCLGIVPFACASLCGDGFSCFLYKERSPVSFHCFSSFGRRGLCVSNDGHVGLGPSSAGN